jgi:hypothetical protein
MSVKIFILCNKEREPERYQFQQEQIEKHTLENCTFFTHCWSNDITKEMRDMYCKTDTAMRTHGRNMKSQPLRNTEISLFLNWIECLRQIKREYSDGLFLILEADAILIHNFSELLRSLVDLVNEISDWDIVNIGEGCGPCQKNKVFPSLTISKQTRNRCTEGVLWNYKSICKFLELFNETTDIDAPIDVKIDYYSFRLKKINIYWSQPFLAHQGSKSNKFKSNVR